MLPLLAAATVAATATLFLGFRIGLPARIAVLLGAPVRRLPGDARRDGAPQAGAAPPHRVLSAALRRRGARHGVRDLPRAGALRGVLGVSRRSRRLLGTGAGRGAARHRDDAALGAREGRPRRRSRQPAGSRRHAALGHARRHGADGARRAEFLRSPPGRRARRGQPGPPPLRADQRGNPPRRAVHRPAAAAPPDGLLRAAPAAWPRACGPRGRRRAPPAGRARCASAASASASASSRRTPSPATTCATTSSTRPWSGWPGRYFSFLADAPGTDRGRPRGRAPLARAGAGRGRPASF